jgi:uncharacterized protein (UPF0276 family)
VNAAARNPVTPTFLPPAAGIGLRAPHYREVVEARPRTAWFEVHSENFFGAGGQPHWFLERVRAHYPLSLHGVGLGLGSTDPLSQAHLSKLAGLIERYEPALVSEHLCWSAVQGRHLNDLLPLPLTEEALVHVCERIDTVQTVLGRQILVENISSYLRYRHSTIPEWEFVAEAARRSGCGILLDVNNVFVSAVNHGFDPRRYLAAIPGEAVGEIHLAGFTAVEGCLIDTHGTRVSHDVWRLYAEVVERIGPRPTLIEWDTDIPPLEVLLGEARQAQQILEQRHALAA